MIERWTENWLVFRSIENLSHFANNVIVKRSSEIIENSFLKKGILEFCSEAVIVSILIHSSNFNYDHNQNTIYAKILIPNIHEKITKIVIYFLQ